MSRRLKIQPKTVKTKNLPGYKIYPSIKLEGLWVQEAGFHPYKNISVVIENNSIIIKPLTEINGIQT